MKAKKTTRKVTVDMRCPSCDQPLRGRESVAVLARPPTDIKRCKRCKLGVAIRESDILNCWLFKAKTAPRAPIILPARQYDRLVKLVFWFEDTPDEIELSDSTCDQVWETMGNAVNDYLLPGESAMVETGKGWQTIVAVVEKNDGTEERVPVDRREYKPRRRVQR